MSLLRRVGRRAYEELAERVARTNSRWGTNLFYRSERLLPTYLSDERLRFYDELASIFAPLAPRSVLDVGCGTGHLLVALTDRMEATPDRIVGVDHAEAGIRRARALLPAGVWLVDDVYTLSVEGEPFDLVVCTEVLEHLHEPDRAVRVLRAHCAPGGRVAITVPDGATDSWAGHVNFWDEDALRAFLESHGLVSIDRVENGTVLLAWLKA